MHVNTYVQTRWQIPGSAELERTGGILNATASRKGLLSFWVDLDLRTGAVQTLLRTHVITAPSPRWNIAKLVSSNTLRSIFFDVTGTYVEHDHGITAPNQPAWMHIIASWDLDAGGAGVPASHFYIDDVIADAPAFTDSYVGNFDWAAADLEISIGHFGGGAEAAEGKYADVFLNDSYLDLSIESNRRKFRDGDGYAVDLGADGSTPLATQPLVYFGAGQTASALNAGTNLGRCGAFTTAASTITDESSIYPPFYKEVGLAKTVESAIDYAGESLRLRQTSAGTYSGVTRSYTGETTTPTAVTGVVTEYDERHVDGSVVQAGDLKIELSAAPLVDAAIVPEPDDYIERGGTRYRVMTVRVRKAQGGLMSYRLQVRGVE